MVDFPIGHTLFRGPWVPPPDSPTGGIYRTGHLVQHNGWVWVCRVDNAKRKEPGTDEAVWTKVWSEAVPIHAGFPTLYQGKYNAATAYTQGQIVTHRGATYALAADAVAGTTPPAVPWMLLATDTSGNSYLVNAVDIADSGRAATARTLKFVQDPSFLLPSDELSLNEDSAVVLGAPGSWTLSGMLTVTADSSGSKDDPKKAAQYTIETWVEWGTQKQLHQGAVFSTDGNAGGTEDKASFQIPMSAVFTAKEGAVVRLCVRSYELDAQSSNISGKFDVSINLR